MLILGIVILVVATVVVVTIPLTQKDMSSEEPAAVDLTLAKLEEEKEAAYNALKEAEFDYETGKLSDEDYRAIKDKYSAKAVGAIKKLEKYQGETEVRGERREARKENPVRAGDRPREAGLSPKTETTANFCSNCGAKIEKSAKFCSACGLAQSKVKANTCPSCGTEYKKGTKFCASCGQRLN